MNFKKPLISCICITAYQPLLLQRALACFRRQDYPNTEVVISYPDDDLLTKAIIDRIESLFIMKMIRVTHPKEEKMVLTKNNAINAANGDFICIWNDGDWHHVNRISDQYRTLKNGPFFSSILTHILLFDFKSKQTYLSVYREWEGTLLCEKQFLLQAIYIDIERTDDNSIIRFLSSKNVLYHISESPHLYIYICDQNHPSKDLHCQNCFSESDLLGDINETVQDLINIDHYLLEC